VSASTHRFAAGCDAVRAAYQRPGAPVPPGTTVTVAADGGLRFQAPFGPAAAFLRDDADAGCTYQIEASSTIVVAGPDVPNLDDFLTVTCLQPLGIALFAVAEVDVDGQPHTLAFVLNEPVPNPPQERPYMIGFYPGLPIDLLGGSSEPPGAQTFPNLVGTYDPATARGTVSGAGPTGPISGSFQCTVNNLDVPGF